MGDLIVMTLSKKFPGLPPSSVGGADILFFTGVRYYRMTEDTPIVVAPKRRRRTVATEPKVKTAKPLSIASPPYELQA